MNSESFNVKNQVAYGMKDGAIVHIADVERGLECGCTCVSCGAVLMAKKGEKNTHHFAHHNGEGEHCSESILHKLGKEIIVKHLQIGVHAFSYAAEQEDVVGNIHQQVIEDRSYTLQLQKAQMEKASESGLFRPDITATVEEESLYIEIVVTHGVSDTKLDNVIKEGVPMLSVDMSAYTAMDSMEILTQAVLKDAPRQWVYHPQHESARERIDQSLIRELQCINAVIKERVMQEYHLVEASTHTSLQRTKSDQIILLGYKSVFGYSQKKKQDFDFSILMLANDINDSSGPNYNVRSKKGFDTSTIGFEENLIAQLEQMHFPCVAQLEVKNIFTGGRSRPVVSAINVA